MNKKDILQRLEAVCNTLDNGITVSGVKNAANLAGCYTVLQEVIVALNNYEIVELDKEEIKSEE